MTDLDREILKIAAQPGPCREARALVLAAGATQSGEVSLETAVKLLMEPEMPIAMRLIPLGQKLPTVAGEYYFMGCCIDDFSCMSELRVQRAKLVDALVACDS